MISKKLVAASILAAMGSSSAFALDPIKVGQWDLTISGSVNAYYTNTKCKSGGDGAVFTGNATGLNPCGFDTTNGVKTNNIQNGLLPGFVIFTAATKQNGYDISGTISIDPGTSTDGGTFGANGAGGGRGNIIGDQRRNFLTVGNEKMGTFKLGRDIGLFGQNAILNDMTLVSVGGGSGFNGALNTTLGAIGSGYVYTQFQPQITYTSPKMNGLQLSAGGFQQVATPNIPATAGNDRQLGFQGMATYDLANGKVWATVINQNYDRTAGATTNPANITGGELGGNVNFGALGLTANYFTGKGLGTGLIGLGGTDGVGEKRDSDGYLLQATYKVGDTKFGVNYGQSKLDATSNDRATATQILDKNQQYTVGVYHNLTPSLLIAGEFTSNKASYQLGAPTPEAKANTIAIGAILFF